MEALIAKEQCSSQINIVRGIALTPPVIGRITAGHTVKRGDHVLPVRDDHYTLTTLVQNKETRAFDRHALHDQILSAQSASDKAEAKLQAIPVRIAYNNVNLNLNNSYSAFDPKKGRALCVGNGERARRITEDGIKEMDCPRPEACAFGQSNRCRNFTRAYFRIEGQEDELGTFILRSTSYNTVDRLGSRLSQLSGLTGGKIAGMPMMLVLRPKSTTQSMRDVIYFSDLVPRPGMSLLAAVAEAREYQKSMEQAGLSLDGLEAALEAGLANSDFADELEDPDEWVSDDDLIAAVESAQAKGNKGSLAGLTSLTEKLAAQSKELAEKSAGAAAAEGGSVTVPLAKESASQDGGGGTVQQELISEAA